MTEIETVFVLVEVEIHVRTDLVLATRQADEVEEDVGRSHTDLGLSAVAGSDFPDLGGLEVARVIDRVAEVEGNRSANVAADAEVELFVFADDGKTGDFGSLIVVRGVFGEDDHDALIHDFASREKIHLVETDVNVSRRGS